MKTTIFVDILLLLGAVCLFAMCTNGNRTTYNNDNITHASYNINHYLDTIEGHIILTTVCDEINSYNVSVSTLELNN